MGRGNDLHTLHHLAQAALYVTIHAVQLRVLTVLLGLSGPAGRPVYMRLAEARALGPLTPPLAHQPPWLWNGPRRGRRELHSESAKIATKSLADEESVQAAP